MIYLESGLKVMNKTYAKTPLKVVEANVNEALYKNLAMEFKKLKSGLNDSMKQVEAIEALAAEMFGKL
jgi:hypothetical protein